MDRMIEALEGSQTVRQACKKLGVSEQAVYQMLKRHGLKVVYDTRLKVVSND